MGLFGFGKKKEEPCNCAGGCNPAPVAEPVQACGCGDCGCGAAANEQEAKAPADGAAIAVLGSGCKSCITLEANVKEALQKMGQDAEVAHITDFAEIANYGVMSTPALVVDGKVVSVGKVLKADEVVDLLQKARGV